MANFIGRAVFCSNRNAPRNDQSAPRPRRARPVPCCKWQQAKVRRSAQVNERAGLHDHATLADQVHCFPQSVHGPCAIDDDIGAPPTRRVVHSVAPFNPAELSGVDRDRSAEDRCAARRRTGEVSIAIKAPAPIA